jgi:hypothetical protein
MDGTGAIKWQQQQSVREGKVFNQAPDLFLGQDSRPLFAGAIMMFLVCNKFSHCRWMFSHLVLFYGKS